MFYYSCRCNSDLGMKSGIIPPSAVTASASQSGYEPTHARLDDGQGWYSPERTSSSDYLQIDTGTIHYITKVATQVRIGCRERVLQNSNTVTTAWLLYYLVHISTKYVIYLLIWIKAHLVFKTTPELNAARYGNNVYFQGAPCCDVMVTNYTLQYSTDGTTWKDYKKDCQTEVRLQWFSSKNSFCLGDILNVQQQKPWIRNLLWCQCKRFYLHDPLLNPVQKPMS